MSGRALRAWVIAALILLGAFRAPAAGALAGEDGDAPPPYAPPTVSIRTLRAARDEAKRASGFVDALPSGAEPTRVERAAARAKAALRASRDPGSPVTRWKVLTTNPRAASFFASPRFETYSSGRHKVTVGSQLRPLRVPTLDCSHRPLC